VKLEDFCVRSEVSLKDKVYLKTYYHHSQDDIQMDETPIKILVQNLQITIWTLIKEQQLVKLNFSTMANAQYIKVNSQLTNEKIEEFQMLLKEFKDVFEWTYKDLKSIPLELAQHRIELNASIPQAHQARYKLNPNYVVVVKQDINKLLIARFIQPVEEVTWLSPIVVMFQKNGKLRICVDFRKFNKVTKKNPYPLPFSNEVLNIITRYQAYPFLDGYSRYHQISIAFKDIYKTTFITDWGAFV